MASIPSPASPGIPSGLIERYAPVAALALACAGILIAHAQTAASIVAIWWRSETYAHGFVVVPIALWLAWQRRDEIAATPALPWWPALAGVALAGALWFVMTLGDIVGVRQFALAFMLQAAIVAIVGWRVAKVAAFPIVFLLFAIPVGEFMIPTLIEWTADFTVAALRASGVPVYREANQFVIPSGAWSVVEACSGLRYLIASVMIGVVYAAVTYTSRWRRAAFIAASVVIPVIANWLRAYLIVMLGHLSDNQLAAGVDHLIYGWVFFGVVMALTFWVGSFWSERRAAVVSGGQPRVTGDRSVSGAGFFVVAIAAIVAAGVWRPLVATVEQRPTLAAPVLGTIEGAGGFAPASVPGDWKPSYAGHAAALREGYTRAGRSAGLYIAFYRNQAKGRELITSGNQLVLPQDNFWKEVERSDAMLAYAGRPVGLSRSVIVGLRERERLIAYRLFWVDGRVTGSEYVAKALLAWSRLTGRNADAALIVTFAPETAERDVAREAMEALSVPIGRVLDATGGRT
jgi:exosortase A